MIAQVATPHDDAPPERPVRLRAARAARAGRLDRARAVRPPGARRRRGRARRARPSWRPSGSWRRPGCARTTCRRTSSSWRCGWPTEYCSTPARSLQLVLPPRGQAAHRAVGVPHRRAARRGAAHRQPAGAAGRAADARHGRSSRRCGGSRRAAWSRSSRASAAARRAPTSSRGAPVALTPDQEAAIGGRRGAAGASHLLHGVTGSGKTEVYLRAAAAALERGEGVIVLVPEIALTPQTVGRFQARFGDTVALLHSALGEGERYDEWRRLRTGEARIAVGPRSAVFAPVADLGLIVVDEEHDASYKHEGDPRYDARTVAAERARRAGARLLVGTATPRPETWHALAHLKLPDRVDARPLPPVRVLDMRGARHPLHPETRRALASARKSIVLLNRRGWSNFLTCRSCGKTWECPQLRRRARPAPRRERDRLPPLRPPRARARSAATPAARCRSPATAPARSGSSTSCARGWTCRCSGSTPTPPAPRTPCPSCSRASAPRPRGCCSARRWSPRATTSRTSRSASCSTPTRTLRFPDFRAEERTFALIAQLAGRAGRGRARRPRARADQRARTRAAIAAAARHDAEGFLAGELERRRALGYPPFADLIRVVCSAEDGAPARAAAGAVAAARRRRSARTEVLGPAPLFRLRGRERFQVVVKTARARARPCARRAPRSRPRRATARTATSPSASTSTRSRRRRVPWPQRWTTRSRPAAHARRRPRRSASGSTPRPAPAATRRSSSSASTATPSCAAARSRSSASTSALPRRSGAWARSCTTRSASGSRRPRSASCTALLVYRVDPDAPVAAVVNPTIEWTSEEREPLEEGCLVAAGRAGRGRAARSTSASARSDEQRRGAADRGLGSRGAGAPARDRPPRRRPDPGPHVARPAQAGDARPPRGGRRHAHRSASAPDSRARVRTVYLGTSSFAATVLERLARERAPARRWSSPAPTRRAAAGAACSRRPSPRRRASSASS